MRCYVCKVRSYNKADKTSKISLFSVPKTDSLKFEWEKSLGVHFKTTSKVCSNHFKKEDIIDTWVSGQGLNKYTVNINKHKDQSNYPINLLTNNNF